MPEALEHRAGFDDHGLARERLAGALLDLGAPGLLGVCFVWADGDAWEVEIVD